jgi:metal-dependent HD superfamily phosphatase/phosphodiesterase
MKSPREMALDNKLIETVEGFGLSGKAVMLMRLLLQDDEVQVSQNYANTVSIVRMGYNDHGPVHMKTVVMNALLMVGLLNRAGIKTSLEQDDCGCLEDSLSAIICAAMLHDLGMGVGREDHEFYSICLAKPIMDRILAKVYESNVQKRVMIRTLALEGIAGHMGVHPVHSLEAGVIQVADGCDMTKGRARIPIALAQASKGGGHIHQYSASSIEEVRIVAGREKPILIDVHMSNEVGLFQVEEVLLKKISSGTAVPYIELEARVGEETVKQYL